jgi:hypothetical protein
MVARGGKQPRGIQQGDIAPLGVFAERARETLDFERGAGVKINIAEVPPTLRHLIPFIERWAIPGSSPQSAFIEHLEETSPRGIDVFCQAMKPHLAGIREWNQKCLASQGANTPTTVPEALNHFVYALGAYELAKPVDPDLIARNQERADARQIEEARKQAILAAAEAFRSRRFDEVVRLLEPYQSELTDVESKRFEIAKKNSS